MASPVGEVVICGAGIMGASTAYHLAKLGVSSTIVERNEIAGAASGKAGGFLAQDWSNHSALGPLATLSFRMHMELAETFKDVGYRRLGTFSIDVQEGANKHGKKEVPKLLDWINGSGVVNASEIGTPSTTAQVHPEKLTKALFNAAQNMVGSKLRIGTVTDIALSNDEKKVIGVRLGDEIIPADIVIITMGPWSGQASKWLKTPMITGLKAHSIVIRPEKDIGAHAIFINYSGREGNSSDPEIYPRPDGEVYVCGMSDGSALPDDPKTITPTDNACNELKEIAGKVSSELTCANVLKEQACFLPCPPGSLPIIGKVAGIEGAFIATGHTCWGILNAPATGAVLADLIVKGKTNLLDISPFDPARF